MAEGCKYENDIQQLKTDRTIQNTQYVYIRKDLDEIKKDLKNLLHNGIIDKKVEAAMGRMMWRFFLAAAASGGGIAAVVSYFIGG
jgi:hypothetical protein